MRDELIKVHQARDTYNRARRAERFALKKYKASLGYRQLKDALVSAKHQLQDAEDRAVDAILHDYAHGLSKGDTEGYKIRQKRQPVILNQAKLREWADKEMKYLLVLDTKTVNKAILDGLVPDHLGDTKIVVKVHINKQLASLDRVRESDDA